MSQSELHVHPVLAAIAAVDAALKAVSEVEPVFMTTEEKGQAILGLSAGIDRLEELRMRVLAAADDVAIDEGARDVAAWWAHHGRRDPAECRRRLRLARSLGDRDAVTAALRQGEINLDQASVVVGAIESLPDEVDPDVRRAAETRLVGEASTFGPRQLRILGRRCWTSSPRRWGSGSRSDCSTRRPSAQPGGRSCTPGATATARPTSGPGSPTPSATG